MIVRYWQPFQEMNAVKHQLDRLFDDFAGVETAPTTWTPAATLVESEEALILQVQLPGINIDDIDVQASREVVAVSGTRPSLELTEGETLRRNEFRYGAFRRVVSLPVAIDHNAVTADYEAGVLVLTLPKAEDVRNKVVKVNIAGAKPAAITEATDSTEDKQ
ncbi:Hsp20/alpha crystallin family protein [cf. Phormidesmis sp. LEGE 11477]|uniref:Hsp20/alpha crystallin family protein n=1 Tax=cf. Phormidesmis sp. LEGE 11477 TaxID=1828680 RepID=UPI001882A612|nr:Hsp20/alpha crystallin family protein [cf. Phormidesmis sp. LEGE 11477]MBE9063093.1 Hsp20/alpha crystallin family protein [cf. Phormidesmis sp. LEGE 11477]